LILIDTSGLLAAIDKSQHRHAEATGALRDHAGPRLLSPFVLAELDYLVQSRVGQSAALELLREVSRDAYRLEPFNGRDVAAARSIIERYADLGLGLADASIVVLAERYGASDVLTLDERHFRAVRGPGGRPFRLLPPDL
jgi:predicted nucleic acid-binding protein